MKKKESERKLDRWTVFRYVACPLVFLMIVGCGLWFGSEAIQPTPATIILPKGTYLLEKSSTDAELRLAVIEEKEPGSGVFLVVERIPHFFENLESFTQRDSGEFEIIISRQRILPGSLSLFCFVMAGFVVLMVIPRRQKKQNG